MTVMHSGDEVVFLLPGSERSFVIIHSSPVDLNTCIKRWLKGQKKFGGFLHYQREIKPVLRWRFIVKQ